MIGPDGCACRVAEVAVPCWGERGGDLGGGAAPEGFARGVGHILFQHTQRLLKLALRLLPPFFRFCHLPFPPLPCLLPLASCHSSKKASNFGGASSCAFSAKAVSLGEHTLCCSARYPGLWFIQDEKISNCSHKRVACLSLDQDGSQQLYFSGCLLPSQRPQFVFGTSAQS